MAGHSDYVVQVYSECVFGQHAQVETQQFRARQQHLAALRTVVVKYRRQRLHRAVITIHPEVVVFIFYPTKSVGNRLLTARLFAERRHSHFSTVRFRYTSNMILYGQRSLPRP